MNKIKNFLMFFFWLYIIPSLTVLVTSFVFSNEDFIEYGLWEFLIFDYILAYTISSFWYTKKVQKYIYNKQSFFAAIFFILWIFDVFLILIYK